MDKMLTEIRTYSLFHEYLNMAGATSPANATQEWEYKSANRLVARIRRDPQGIIRYYIDARAISSVN